MKYLRLTLIALLTNTLYATQAVEIDMHGGKESKTPSALTEKKPKIFYGKILEIKNAQGYKYLHIQEEKGKKIWVAIANAPVSVGEKIGYDKKTMMKDFESKSLHQKFETIYFASDVYLAQKNQAPQSMKSMLGLAKKDPHASMGRGLSPQKEEEKPSKPFVKKASYSIEEIHMWRKSLKDQNITLKGTVFKVSRGIMKRDWVHLGDGSGNEKMLTDDLVFTTPTSSIKSGDKVIAKGKVIVDKDFGYGYFYKVIIEDASFELE